MAGKRNILIVVNPASGRSSYEAKLNYLRGELERAGLDFGTYFTEHEKPGELKKWLDARVAFDEIFVMGGDGTLNMVVNELYPSIMPIAIVSNGTGNDSVKSLHGELQFEKQVEIAINGKIKHFDLGVCNDRYFVNGVGIGFDGEVVREMVERGDKRGRHIDYLITVIRIIGGFKEKLLRFKLDEKPFEKKILLMTVSNGTTFGGGFIINPFARTDDGLLDVCVINEIAPLKRFWHLPKLKFGAHSKIKEAEFFTARQITIDPTSELVAHLDGEYLGHPPFNISIIRKALPVRVPV